jgi:hypothetical protein
MTFQPGTSGNPKGRPAAHLSDSHSRELRLKAEDLKKGGIDTLVFLAGLVAADELPATLRMQAAGLILPYQHARAARFIGKPVELPVVTNAAEATAAIAQISTLAAAGTIGLDEANDLVAHQKAFIEARVALDTEQQLAELKQLVERLSSINAAAIGVTVTGGLPDLPLPPGTPPVIMPALKPPENGADQ